MTINESRLLGEWYNERMKEYNKLAFKATRLPDEEKRLKLLKIILTELSLVATTDDDVQDRHE